MTTAAEFTGPSVELLQALIRNECVNDGTPDSGNETRNSDLLVSYLEGTGVDIQTYTPRPGRDSMIARIAGSDPNAPSLCLMGHTDVVPVNRDGWTHDPFAADIIDGEIWGRGAVDMLNLTSTMAVVFRQLANENFKPKGDLIYFGVADEEAGGVWGAEWMAEHHWDDMRADHVLTELGGWSTVDDHGTRPRVHAIWCRQRTDQSCRNRAPDR
jgi:acetylornithine deacetylase/succinyl-diaminopimelate desuccinylase-like protein